MFQGRKKLLEEPGIELRIFWFVVKLSTIEIFPLKGFRSMMFSRTSNLPIRERKIILNINVFYEIFFFIILEINRG